MRLSIKILTTLFLVQCLSAGFLTPVHAATQDDKDNATENSSDQQGETNSATSDSLEDLKQQWSDLDFKLKAKEQEFPSGDDQ